MKVSRIRTQNFAGLGDLEIKDLARRSEVFVSGRNGIGKSQLLLCIALVAQNDLTLHEATKYIGNMGSNATITVDFFLSSEEVKQLMKVATEYDPGVKFCGDILSATVRLFASKYPEKEWADQAGDESISSIMEDSFARRELPFTEVTYLPADRTVARSPELTFSLASLARSKTLEISQDTLNQQLSDWDVNHNFDVFSSLAALHYAGMLARSRESATPRLDKDFEAITTAFEVATNKRILEPQLKEDGSIVLEVELPTGERHGLNVLSSGELLALQLLHFVKHHFHQGSILLIDEPEQHLHPSLQVQVANAVRQGVGQGHLWLVTHSPNLLNVAPGDDVVVLSREEETGEVQASFADSETRQIEVLEELGVAPGLWVPGNFLVVVEGTSDSLYLQRLLPELFGLAFFVPAGGSSSVRSLAAEMRNTQRLPFLALLDRDQAADSEYEEWNAGCSQFMWSGYAIESIFLDPNWISGTLHDLDQKWTVSYARERLDAAIDAQRDQAKKLWLRSELKRRVPSRESHTASLVTNAKTALEVAQERFDVTQNDLEILEDNFNEEWSRSPLKFVDPKRALGELGQHPFRNKETLINGMLSKLKSEPVYLPSDVQRLEAKVNSIISRA